MDITGRDITILIATTTGVILMSILFPTLGLAGDQANSSDVPEFSISSDRFDIAGDLPARPSEQGDQKFDGTLNISYDSPGDSEFITGSTDDGIEVVAINQNASGQYADIEIELQKWYQGDVSSGDLYDNGTLTTEGQEDTLTIGAIVGYGRNITATFTLSNVSNEGTNNFTATVGYTNNLDEEPDSLIDWGGVPIIGDLISGGLEVAAGVFWIGEVVFWLVELGFEMLLNTINVVLQLVTFIFDLVSFLLTTYGEVTTSSELAGWAQVILLIPGLLMMIEWMKLAAVLVSIIWIG